MVDSLSIYVNIKIDIYGADIYKYIDGMTRNVNVWVYIMSVKAAVNAQYQRIVDKAVPLAHSLVTPSEGWLRTVRKALGMSGPQLAARLGVTRARISALELSEAEGAVTLKTMQEAAQAMGCTFVYAIVPDGTVSDVIEQRARMKAHALVHRSSKHMALEDQRLTPAHLNAETERVLKNILAKRPPDFWEDP